MKLLQIILITIFFISHSEIYAQEDVIINFNGQGCVDIDDGGPYIEIHVDSTTCTTWGNNLIIWIQTSLGLSNYITTASIASTSTGCTYKYYPSSIGISILNQCYTVYVYGHTPGNSILSGNSIFSLSVSQQVCPCDWVIPSQPDHKKCLSEFNIQMDANNPNTFYFCKTLMPLYPIITYWTFGDGNSSYLNCTSHTYSNSGFYNVCLTVSDPDLSYRPCFTCKKVCVDGEGGVFGELNKPTAIHERKFDTKGNNFSIFPNPTYDRFNISFELLQSGNVEVYLFDITGRKINRLIKDMFEQGKHTVEIKDLYLNPGIYFIKIQTPAGSQTERLTVVK